MSTVESGIAAQYPISPFYSSQLVGVASTAAARLGIGLGGAGERQLYQPGSRAAA